MIPTPPIMTVTHEVLNQGHALENYNAYAYNLPLQEAVRTQGADWAQDCCWRVAPKSAAPSGSSTADWPTSIRRSRNCSTATATAATR